MQKQAQEKVEEKAPLVCTKEPYREPNQPLKIRQIEFGLQAPHEIMKCGVIHVYDRTLYKMPERQPHPHGVLDRRMGISNKTAVCETCGQKLVDCSGHFGYIKLELPVFHIGYFKNTIQILQCICKYCSHLLLPEEERIMWLKRFRNPRTERVQKQMMFRKLVSRCKLVRCCPCCGEWNGVVKKATGCLKIIHDRYKNKGILEEYKETFLEASNYNDQLGTSLNRLFDDMNPLRVLDLFERIPDEHCEVLDLVGRPETLLMTHIAVPPLCIRPSVEMDSTSNEDDITMKLTQIIEVNNILRSGLDKGLPINQLMENWDFLQVQAACLINSDLPGIPPTMQQPGRPLRGFVQRLKGKQGRFRGNLSGKRVDFSGRTVISPDPNLMIHQVGVPRHMAVVLTYPERVTQHNLAKLRQRVLNGVATHPGANFVISADGQVKTFLKYGDRRRVAADLKVGDVVERHLEDGDVILFNRQPSLHRISIMAFRAKVRTWRTLRFNECVCSPFNADFDGDEMNLHLPQTEEARAEAINLMGSVNNLCTPKNGDVMISATQDFLTSAFVITSKDMFMTRSEMGLYLASMSDATDAIDLPPPAIIKPVEMWTGKQLFSMLIRPNAKVRLFVNLEMPEKIYSRKGLYMCPNDGYVLFQNSELICGRLGKGILGGHKSGLFGVLNSDFAATAAAACMTRLSKMAARFLGNRGFSIGIDDVMPKEKLQTAKQKKVDEGYAECDKYIQLYKKGALELQPGCNLEQTLEATVTGVLNNIREIAGKVCMDTLHWHNSPLIMSQCGSKGSPINIAQMVACVGQQSVSGKRCFNGFKDRTLPHFPRGDKTPAGKGFVANSFFSGLTPTEFFFHTMGGREGLVDTAVKTAETGYMSRRLMKALEDLYVHYDLTVRNAAGGIVQLTYGDDGMDPVSMEGKDGKPLDFERLKLKICAMIGRELTGADRFTEVQLPSEMQALIKKLVDRVELKERGLEESQWCSPAFRTALKGFLHDQVKSLTEARERLSLQPGERGDVMLEYLAGMSALTKQQLCGLVQHCLDKYERKRIEPGSTVGAIGAQSIGEPGTQMTLKTFHFAGVASMNVTLGVPRIKEIINGARNISTPIMNVELSINSDVKVARIVKGRLEKTTLGQVAKSIKLVMRPGATSSEAGIVVKIDMETVDVLQLDIDAYSVRTAILAHSRIKLKPEHVGVLNYDKVMVKPADSSKGSLLFNLEQLLSTLPKVIVSGIPTVERAVVNAQKDGTYQLFIEGTNVQRVMATLGVDGTKTTTNHIDEIERYLGIEAARSQIAKEIQKTMGAHGMSIDDRHMMLLADCMTYKGEVLGITRFGIAKMKDSVLHSASFEKTSDHLFDAAIHGRKDDVVGVSESIIMGIPMPTGTGLFKLRHNVGSLKELPQKPMPLLAY